MSIPPRHISHICRRQMSIPLATFLTSAVGRCLFPLAIYGEGVADRPGVRSNTQGIRSNPYPNLKLRIVLRYHDVIKF